MPKSNWECGLCDVCECGFIQYDKINDYMYCMKCHKTWEVSEWEWLVDNSREKEYHENTDVEILKRLNKL